MLLLSKDVPIARLIDSQVYPIFTDRLPLYLKRTGDVEGWLASRAIDSHRTNSRLLKRALRLSQKDDVHTVLAVNAATIPDNYWVKPLNDERLTYADVRFSINCFDDLALTGDANSFNQPPSRTPELTNTGSFEKCWRLIDGEWWMVKAGKKEELFSELLIYYVGQALGFPMAEYEPEGVFIKSRDFTHNASVDFEPAVALIGEEADYVKIYQHLEVLDNSITDSYLQMCYLDALVFNMDRHENNFGVLRDGNTGAVLSLAPFFDHNVALISRGYPRTWNFEHDVLINDFTSLVRYVNKPLLIPCLTHACIARLIRKIPWSLPHTDTMVCPELFVEEWLIRRQDRLMELNRETVRFTRNIKTSSLDLF
jgi:hypothetical protein